MSLGLLSRGYVTGDALTPSGVLSITSASTDRWTPVVARFTSNGDPWIVFAGSDYEERLIFYPTRPTVANQSGDQRWTPMFRDRSSLVIDGTEYVATILPNGGWWRESFSLIFIAGVEMTLVP